MIYFWRRLIQEYFDEIALDTGKYCFGVKDTLRGLELGAVETLIVWENLDITCHSLRSSTGETIIIHTTAPPPTASNNTNAGQSGGDSSGTLLALAHLPEKEREKFIDKATGLAMEQAANPHIFYRLFYFFICLLCPRFSIAKKCMIRFLSSKQITNGYHLGEERREIKKDDTNDSEYWYSSQFWPSAANLQQYKKRDFIWDIWGDQLSGDLISVPFNWYQELFLLGLSSLHQILLIDLNYFKETKWKTESNPGMDVVSSENEVFCFL